MTNVLLANTPAGYLYRGDRFVGRRGRWIGTLTARTVGGKRGRSKWIVGCTPRGLCVRIDVNDVLRIDPLTSRP